LLDQQDVAGLCICQQSKQFGAGQLGAALVPKPMTSGLLAKGRFGKQDFVLSPRMTFIFVPPVSG